MNRELSNKLAVGIVRFLKQELESKSLDADASESVEVAVQCLESAYGIDEAKLHASSVDLVDMYHSCSDGSIGGGVVDKEQAEVYKNEGNELMKVDSYEDAVGKYSKAIEMDPTNAVYYCNRAAARSKLNKHHEAIEDCTTALMIDPSYSKAYGRLGIAYSALNQHDLAHNSYLKALELEPDNESYKNNITLCNEQIRNKQSGDAQTVPNRSGDPPFDLASIMNVMENPAFVSMATQLLGNPSVQNLMTNTGLGGGNGMDELLSASRQFVQQMQESDPAFLEGLRRRVQQAAPNEDGSQPPPPPTDNNEHGQQ